MELLVMKSRSRTGSESNTDSDQHLFLWLLLGSNTVRKTKSYPEMLGLCMEWNTLNYTQRGKFVANKSVMMRQKETVTSNSTFKFEANCNSVLLCYMHIKKAVSMHLAQMWPLSVKMSLIAKKSNAQTTAPLGESRHLTFQWSRQQWLPVNCILTFDIDILYYIIINSLAPKDSDSFKQVPGGWYWIYCTKTLP